MKRTFNLLFLALILVLIVNLVGRPLPSAQATGAQPWPSSIENESLAVPALVDTVRGSSNVYAPAIIYVDQNATGANNGISWANAYTDLQSALAVASSSDEIWVAAGTYKPTSGTDRAISFTLKNGVAMYGGFAGAETSRAERDVNTNVAVLSGDVGVVGNNSDNSYHVVVGSNTNNSAVLDGFTIMAGKTRDDFGTSAEYRGGGIYTDSGNPVLSNLIIRENSARIGNGIYNYKSSPILVNVAFIDNKWFAGSVAGAMVNEDDSSPTLTNVMFINNSGWQGGALFNVRRSNPTLLNVIFAGNSTSDRGGAIYNSSSNPILTNVTFRENSATQGGAIFNDGDSNPTLVNVTFTGNSASDRGGAIYNYYSNPTLNSVTFHENSAIQGGAIFNDYSWHSIIMNSILYGDTGGEIYNYSTPATVNYSIVQGGYLGTGNIDIDPLLGPLQDNGGFTQTMGLSVGSPAIDTGYDANCPSTDQRGVARPQGSQCDIGAYEYEPESTIHHVKWNATGTNNGTSWANAYTDLQSALAVASSSDEIWVATGTYKPTAGTDRNATFALISGVEIYGGFAGIETVLSQRNPAANLTILSGDIGILNDISDNSFNVVTGENLDSTTVLDGFTIAHGNANAFSTPCVISTCMGGGLYNDNSSATLSNLVFSNNSASYDGGGIYNHGTYNERSNPVLSNVTFSGNSADYGGGMGNYTSNPVLTNVTFSDNSADYGAGMYNLLSDPILTRVTFSNNSGGQSGGGMSNHDSNLTLTDVTFSGNSADYGGGIYNSGISDERYNLTLTNVTFSSNSAKHGGGIYNDYYSNPTLTNVTFNDNSASVSGGGMENFYHSSPTLTNVTFSHNLAVVSGGGMYNANNYSYPHLTNVTFSGNEASIGGGIYNDAYGNSIINNSIFYGNLGGEIDNYSGMATVTYSIVQGGYPGTGNLNANPLLGPLQDNGGSTQTMSLDTGSSAIDAGDDVNCPSTDQRGVTRPQGSHCDIGAYELSDLTVSGNAGASGAIVRVVSFGYRFFVVADNNGNYSFKVLPGWSGAVIPSKQGYSFQPAKRDYSNIQSNQTSQDYSATANTFTYPGYPGATWRISAPQGGGEADGWSDGPSISANGRYVAYVSQASNIVPGDWANDIFVYDIQTGQTSSASVDSNGTPFDGNSSSPFISADGRYVAFSSFTGGGGMYWIVYVYDRHTGVSDYISRGFTPSLSADDRYIAYTSTNNDNNQPRIVVEDLFTEVSMQISISPTGGEPDGDSYLPSISADGRFVAFYSLATNLVDGDTNGVGDVFVYDLQTEVLRRVSVNSSGAQANGASFAPSFSADGRYIAFHSSASNLVSNDTNSVDDVFVSDLQTGEITRISVDSNGLEGNQASDQAHLFGNGRYVAFRSLATNLISGDTNGAPEIFIHDRQSGQTRRVSVDSHGAQANGDSPSTDSLRFSISEDGNYLAFSSDATNLVSSDTNEDTDIFVHEINCASCINVSIGGDFQGNYYVPSHESTRQSFLGVNKGPVNIISNNSVPVIGAERVIYNVNGTPTSFSEMMALPDSQLDNTYWMPWYNNIDLDTQLRFGNVTGSAATVQVWIGGHEMTTGCTPSSMPYPYVLAPGASLRVSCPGVNNGPVKIISNVNIVAAERVIYNVNGLPTSFTEMMGLPDGQLDKTYWMPWYNNVDLDTQLRFGNVSDTPATVHVWIGGHEMTTGCTPSNIPYPYVLSAGASLRVSCPGVNNGPVKIISNVNIVAAERVIYNVNGLPTSFSEMMGLPDSQLNNTYWMPWYNNVDLDTQLRFGNVNNTSATVRVWIGGQEVTTGCTPSNIPYPYVLAAGASLRVSCPGVNNGPVKIVSNIPIVAAERVIYKVNNLPTSFSEMMGLLNSQLNTNYWLPWYNNIDLDTQLRFGVP